MATAATPRARPGGRRRSGFLALALAAGLALAAPLAAPAPRAHAQRTPDCASLLSRINDHLRTYYALHAAGLIGVAEAVAAELFRLEILYDAHCPPARAIA